MGRPLNEAELCELERTCAYWQEKTAGLEPETEVERHYKAVADASILAVQELVRSIRTERELGSDKPEWWQQG